MNRLKELREDRDLLQKEVAEITGIEQRTLSNYETGKTNPDSETIIKLAEFYGVSCDYLLGVNKINVTESEDIVKELERLKQRITQLQKYISFKL